MYSSYFSPSDSRNPPYNRLRLKIEQSPEEQVILIALNTFVRMVLPLTEQYQTGRYH